MSATEPPPVTDVPSPLEAVNEPTALEVKPFIKRHDVPSKVKSAKKFAGMICVDDSGVPSA